MLIQPLPPEIEAVRAEVRRIVEERVIPAEETVLAEDREGRGETLAGLQELARSLGLWTPHLPEPYGRGLGPLGMAALFREMGRSMVGPKVFHCDAPDQGNMQLLLEAGSEEQRRRWLDPLARGEIASAFCMTEPAPGAGADPANLLTRAEPDGPAPEARNGGPAPPAGHRSGVASEGRGCWRLEGHKWFASNGGRADLLIVMARTGEGATMFLVERGTPGVEHVRDVPVLGEDFLDHREAELRFHGVRVGPDAVLGGVGEGFRLAQRRLVPARLTHCMRWLGLADRALAMCRPFVKERVSFGRTLAEHQEIGRMFAEGAAALHAGNLMTFHCAAMLERGEARAARPFSSMTKNHVAGLLCRILDDAIQMHGALGYSEDLPFSRWYRWARAARIADGPDEVHRMLVARDYLAGRLEVL